MQIAILRFAIFAGVSVFGGWSSWLAHDFANPTFGMLRPLLMENPIVLDAASADQNNRPPAKSTREKMRIYWSKEPSLRLGRQYQRARWLQSRLALPIYEQIVERLNHLAEQQRVLCPLSVPIFEELMKQIDARSRTATANLMDVFSRGISVRLARILRRHPTHFPFGECEGEYRISIRCTRFPGAAGFTTKRIRRPGVCPLSRANSGETGRLVKNTFAYAPAFN